MRNNLKRYNKNLVDLARILITIQDEDEKKDYVARNRMVYTALAMANIQGFECGIRNDPEQPEWPVIYIDLPEGQVSWHVPQYPKAWDEHTNEEKYQRIETFARECGIQRMP